MGAKADTLGDADEQARPGRGVAGVAWYRRAPATWLCIGLGVATLVVCSFLFWDRLIAGWTYYVLPPRLNLWAAYVSKLGKVEYALALPAVLVAVGLLRKRRLLVHRMLLTIAATLLGAMAALPLKLVIGRARPLQWLKHEQWGFFPFESSHRFHSFPSGHASTVLALGVIVSLLYRRIGVAVMAAATLVAASRIFSHAHYLSDVLAGAYLGAVVALLTYHGWVRNPKLPDIQPVDR